jgi:hypothetical protein
MEVSMGKSSLNGELTIATFDYRRVNPPTNPPSAMVGY